MDNHSHDGTIITASALSKYQQCPRKYRLSHIDLLDIEGDYANRLIGHTYHKCLEREFSLLDYEDLIIPLQDTIPFPSENKSTSILRGMLSARSALRLSGKLLDGSILECEKELSLDIDGIKWAGKLDRIEEESDGIWVVDTKCRNGRYPMDRSIYEQSIQLGMYTILARHHGYPVLGYIVDVCRIPILKESSSWESYRRKIHDDIVSRPSDYFARFKYHIDSGQVDRIFQNMRYWVNLMKQDIHFVQKFGECIDYRYGYKCEYYGICHEGVNIHSIPRKEKSHIELETL